MEVQFETNQILYRAEDTHNIQIYSEVPLKDWQWLEECNMYVYPCPCGDYFGVTKEQLSQGYVICECPSCSLKVKILV